MPRDGSASSVLFLLFGLLHRSKLPKGRSKTERWTHGAAQNCKVKLAFVGLKSNLVGGTLLLKGGTGEADKDHEPADGWSPRNMQKVIDAYSRTATRIDESRRLLATIESELAILRNRDGRLLSRSRSMIDQSRRLLAALEPPASTKAEKITIEPIATEALAQANCNPAMLSVRVCQEGTRFDWTLFGPTSERLGQGSADTELQARSDAFLAGMTYIEQLKDRYRPTNTSLH